MVVINAFFRLSFCYFSLFIKLKLVVQQFYGYTLFNLNLEINWINRYVAIII